VFSFPGYEYALVEALPQTFVGPPVCWTTECWILTLSLEV